jgi:hypothetical protein
MYRDITVAGPAILELTVFYSNGLDGLSGYSNRFVAPRTLSIDAGPNQQFRVDLLAPTAAPESMADADLRATVFETRPDAPGRRDPTPVRFDLSPWAGQTVRLRIATADNQGPMRAGVDNVRLIPIERSLQRTPKRPSSGLARAAQGANSAERLQARRPARSSRHPDQLVESAPKMAHGSARIIAQRGRLLACR